MRRTHRTARGAGVVLVVALAGVLAWPVPSLAATVIAKVSTDFSGSTARVVVTFSHPIATTVSTLRGKIEVACAEDVTVSPAEAKFDDPVLKGWRQKGDRTLVLNVGSAFEQLESFELRNPARLVLDLQGERPSTPASKVRKESQTRPVVVVDPGHGGVETGAVGRGGTQEKDLTLDLARRLKAALERDAKVTVVLTRDEDRLVPLDERAAIANHNRAELFISVHLNASKRRGAVGAETYFLSPDATDDEARTLAALENRAAGVPETPQAAKPDGEKGLDLILWDLAQNQYLAESGRLAESVQKELNALAGTKDRGVRQAPFRVLMGTTMPAILVEAGFVTNPDEETRLKDPAYQDRIVEALVRAVREYLDGRARLDDPGAAR